MLPNLPLHEGPADGDRVIPLTLDDDEVGYEDLSSGNGSEDGRTDDDDDSGSDLLNQGILLVKNILS